MAPEIKTINTIFFDVGNTLRVVVKDQAFIDKAEADLMELIQTKETPLRASCGRSTCCPTTSPT